MHSDFQRRLHEIVTAVFGGNTSRAAQAAQVEQSTLQRLLTGARSDPRSGTVLRLATGFNVPAAWLLGELACLPDEDRGRSPTWLVLMDLYYDRAAGHLQDELQRLATSQFEPQRIILRIRESRESALDGVLSMLALLEYAGVDAANSASAMAAYRASRELELATLHKLIEYARFHARSQSLDGHAHSG